MKDPAFLFYPGDWLGGTMTFTRSHKGAYMDLLMAQFGQRRLNLEDIKTILGQDFEIMWESKLKSKFLFVDGLYFNKKLDDEIERRQNYANSRRENLVGKKPKSNHMNPHMDPHMETEAEAETKDGKETDVDFPKLIEKRVLETWNTFAKQHSLSLILKLTEKRKFSLHARLKEPEFNFPRILELITGSKFLLGQIEGKPWKVDFDFIFLSRNNYIKILEEKYSDPQAPKPKQDSTMNSGYQQIREIALRKKQEAEIES